ncbi:hypothetical protein ACVW00_000871 [Marmoricola sp. URHA0025 HA25]
MGKALKLPKTECCVSTTRCERCPIRMLKEGTLPAGYGVRKRKLVRFDACGSGTKKTKKVKKVKKSELAADVRRQRKQQKQQKSGKKKLAA